MGSHDYQDGFSNTHPEMFDSRGRRIKAEKILAVLEDHFGGRLSGLTLLDVGSSSGIVDGVLAERVAFVAGVDIDVPAVKYARRIGAPNLFFAVQDGMRLGFADSTFDVVVCAQVYEHVPDYRLLVSEIWRVLKPGGVCYFGASNRLRLIEPHYRLPLLSVIPKMLAHVYIRLSHRADRYYENHLTFWGLKKLVRRFKVEDYTLAVIADPVRFRAVDIVKPGSWSQRLALAVLGLFFWLCPSYIWLLIKAEEPSK